MKKRRWLVLGVGGFLLVLLIVMVVLILSKRISITTVVADKYEMQGIDVSHYQGNIDWNKIEEQGIDFAFIKATEGSGSVDEMFHENWDKAEETQLLIGAYHFFSFDSGADTQAELYMNTVGELEGRFVPVIDVEYYGDKAKNPPDREEVITQLAWLLSILEEHYGKKPVIYTTYTAYYNYIRSGFEDYPLWIRNVYYPPSFELGRDWTFWQYSDTAALEGYTGTEKYIDRNVFCGTRKELEELIVK